MIFKPVDRIKPAGSMLALNPNETVGIWRMAMDIQTLLSAQLDSTTGELQ
jgi:hypothetical protein